MIIELPGGTATIRSRAEISERDARRVSKAENKTMAASLRLIDRGYKDPAEWLKPLTDEMTDEEAEATKAHNIAFNTANVRAVAETSDEDQDIIDDYQSELIMALTLSWSYESVITKDAIESLPHNVVDALAKACQDEMKGTVVETDPDPKAAAPTPN